MAKKQGPFEQLAHRLRVQRGPGNADLVSERPRERIAGSDNYRYTDLDAPTMVSFDQHCLVDVDALIASGAIRVPAAEPAEPKAAKTGEGD